MLYSIGDSHSDYCFNGIPNLQVKWLGPRTMFRVGRDGLSLVNNKHIGIKEGDIAIWSFGEIDVRTHIGRIRDSQRIDLDDIIDQLVTRYMAVAIQNRELVPGSIIVISSVIPPSDKVHREDETLPFYGTLLDRIKITRRLNYRLRTLCAQLNFPFLDLYSPFANDDGFLPHTSRADLLHLDRRFVHDVERILNDELNNYNYRTKYNYHKHITSDGNTTYEAIQLKDFIEDYEECRILSNATVDTRSWLPTKNKKLYIPQIAYQVNTISGRPFLNLNKISSGEFVKINNPEQKTTSIAKGFLVGGNSNYYHTVVDHFVNLYYYDLLNLAARNTPVLIDARQPFQCEMAELLGCSKQLTIALSEDQLVEVEKLYIPNKCFDEWGRVLHPEVFSWLHQKTNKFKGDRQRIYVSRSNSNQRRIANEEEVEALLLSHGFKTIKAEEMSVTDQIAHFSNADFIFGPHGAGLTNIVFSPPSAKVIEAIPGETWKPECFRYMAEGHGQQFERIVAPGKFSDPEFYVDLSLLKQALHKLGA